MKTINNELEMSIKGKKKLCLYGHLYIYFIHLWFVMTVYYCNYEKWLFSASDAFWDTQNKKKGKKEKEEEMKWQRFLFT